MIKNLKLGRLELIAFVGGSVVMVLELIGARILAPYLGNSIFVWTSIIGIILAALSLGYHLGGRLSAQKPTLQTLAGILLVAGVLITITAIIKTPILELASNLGVRGGSVVATLLLFAPASVILGMISPYAIRLKITDVESSGGVAGNLYAISTIGSIVGTFLAGFVLVPLFGSSQLLYGLSGVLILTSLVGGARALPIVLLAGVAAASFVGPAPDSNVIYEADSSYNHIRVVDFTDRDNQDLRALYLATETHSIIFRDSKEVYAEYHKLYQLDNLFKPEITNALTLGGGAYVSVQDYLRRYPEAEMTVVEIDPAVTQTARDYFGLVDDPRLTIAHEDGRRFLNQTTQTFDVIYGDAFSSYFSVPFQLTTLEAIQAMYNALAPDGIVILNVISSLEGNGSIFFQSEYKTFAEVFEHVYVFPAHFSQPEHAQRPQNIVIIASKNSQRLDLSGLREIASPRQLDYVNRLWQRPVGLHPKSIILTDEHAPVDYFISKVL